MNIFRVLARNLGLGPMTVRLPAAVPRPEHFRGPVEMYVEKCICCGMCAYVCVSQAVTVEQAADGCAWAYYPARCTFCGKCVQVCPTRALSQRDETVPSYLRPGELDETHRVPYPICPECGRVAQPADEAVLVRAFPQVTDEMRAWLRLCPRCRRKRTMRDFTPAARTAARPSRARAEEEE
ncbi:MAG: 4Fe-4S binding protein [Acidobacteriota bacterium]